LEANFWPAREGQEWKQHSFSMLLHITVGKIYNYLRSSKTAAFSKIKELHALHTDFQRRTVKNRQRMKDALPIAFIFSVN
jgi:predicted transcriptional regulator